MAVLRDYKFIKILADPLNISINKYAMGSIMVELEQKCRLIMQVTQLVSRSLINGGRVGGLQVHASLQERFPKE